MTTTAICRIVEKTANKALHAADVLKSMGPMDGTTPYWCIVSTLDNDRSVREFKRPNGHSGWEIRLSEDVPQLYDESFAVMVSAAISGYLHSIEPGDGGERVQMITIREWWERRLRDCKQLIETIDLMYKGEG